jgi:DEAD/DEAH box helicase domain-containing protein
MKDYLVFDLETQNSFDDVGGRAYPHLLKISVAGVYSYKEDRYFIFEENQLDEFEEMIKDAALLIGFNTKYFDNAVLQPYLKEVDLKKVPACDIMEDIANVLGHRLSLDAIAKATLNTKKSGHGLDAIKYFREGNMEALKSYCLDDVRITRDIFDYGRKFKEFYYNEKGSDDKLTIPVYWEEYDIDFKNRKIENIIQEEKDKKSGEGGNKKEEKKESSVVFQKGDNYSLF